MRYILGLCVVLAVGNSAWTSEMSSIAGEPEYQTPAATVTSAVNQATGTTAFPVTSPAGAYQTATSQPATTTMSPAPTMISPGTYTAGTQPVATYATPMPNTPYTTYSYPVRMRGGLFGMRSSVYSYPATPVTTTYTHTGPDLHRHSWPDLLPTCPAEVWPVPALATAGDASLRNSCILDIGLLRGAGVYDVRLQYACKLHDDIRITGRHGPREQYDPRREYGSCLYADDARRSERHTSDQHGSRVHGRADLHCRARHRPRLRQFHRARARACRRLLPPTPRTGPR